MGTISSLACWRIRSPFSRPPTKSKPRRRAVAASTAGSVPIAASRQTSVPMRTTLPCFTVTRTRASRTATPFTIWGMEACHRSAVAAAALTGPSCAVSMPRTAAFSRTNWPMRSATTASFNELTGRPRRADTAWSVTRLPTPEPGSSGKAPMMFVAVPVRGSTKPLTPTPLLAASSWFQAARLGSWSSTLATGALAVLMYSSGRKNAF